MSNEQKLLDAFFDWAKISAKSSARDNLQSVVQAFSALPYENITKIIRLHESGNPDQARRCPGEVLREDFMPDFGLTTAALAEALKVSRQTINEILRERRAITPMMALRLSRLFATSPEFWLNAQNARDIWDSEQQHKKELEQIQPLDAA